MKRIMLLLVALLPPLLPNIVWAESVYIIDRLSVALYSGPLNQEPVVKRVNTGDLLEVVERLDNFIKVRDSVSPGSWAPWWRLALVFLQALHGCVKPINDDWVVCI